MFFFAIPDTISVTDTCQAQVVAGTISGTLGGTVAIIGAILAVQKGVRDLEKTEIRRLRVECITDLYGLRYAITDGFAARVRVVGRKLNRTLVRQHGSTNYGSASALTHLRSADSRQGAGASAGRAMITS